MTGKFHVVTDSAVYLPDTFLRQHKVDIMPVTLELEGKRYREGVDIEHHEFLRRLSRSQELPRIIPPSKKDWVHLYQKLVREYPYILVLTHSARLSQTYVHAREAVNEVFGRARFWVVDTQTIGFGQGILVRKAVEAIEAGLAPPDVVRRVRALIPHIYAQFLMDRLDYLEAYGRVGPAQRVLGTMLEIKPILTMEDGELIPVEKVLKWEQGIDKLMDFIVEFLHIEELAVVQYGMDDLTASLLERLEMVFEDREFPIITYSPTLAAHIGPKALGVMVYEGEPEPPI
ncbi:MAG: DegV family protein [Chloroflexi bacterium]|nr:DegV family protein [Chloroflexota bacterium]